eukprot:TRINITY_DN13501_c1_g1_i1.p3 TRINITY_DN13501_c1_g1~~TRINITY_DN13501_c1_g1_i1.p3  ORF type:complete len:127 (+),score=6.69 TRINITY_DN13501_c1_g1_i1:496-876(+)
MVFYQELQFIVPTDNKFQIVQQQYGWMSMLQLLLLDISSTYCIRNHFSGGGCYLQNCQLNIQQVWKLKFFDLVIADRTIILVMIIFCEGLQQFFVVATFGFTLVLVKIKNSAVTIDKYLGSIGKKL